MVLFTGVLIVAGLLALSLGFYLMGTSHSGSLACFLVGGLVLLPGFFQAYRIFRACNGERVEFQSLQ